MSTPSGRPARRSSEERNEQTRAELEPLAPGERPRPVTVAAIVALALAAANVVAALAAGEGVGVGLGFAAILLVSGLGMFAVRYWAVLIFEVMLGLQIVLLSLALLRAETVPVALAVVVLIGALGALFWKLVRPMARMQAPPRTDG
jgi:hypothetical protein